MYKYINDLQELECIMDTLVFEDEPYIFTEEYILDIIETAFHLMDYYMENNPTIISEPDFNDILLEEIKDIFFIQFEDQISKSYDETTEDDIEEILEVAFNLYISTFHIERSIQNSEIIYDKENEKNSDEDNEKMDIIKKKIDKLRNIPQPTQRTQEWYQFRHNLITASNAYKAFESQSTVNQLIYEKCLPIKTNLNNDDKMMNVNTTLHWGQKYEPLSVMIYEYMFDSKVEDFGCIQHPIYKFIGASPDGIIIESNTGKFGRMLEIKNIVNREINGIPKKEYWIQMQLQMEVCDLDDCDFLETKFIEYPDYQTYYNDLKISDNVDQDMTVSSDEKHKGIIIYFNTKDAKPFYAYKPLNIKTLQQTFEWEEELISLYQSEPYNYTFIKIIYWKLEKISCVLVLRNKEWFKNNIIKLEEVWKIIEKERVTGYEHRAPVKKTKKENTIDNYLETNKAPNCLLVVKKLV
jgi:putative phage-type endonuclease